MREGHRGQIGRSGDDERHLVSTTGGGRGGIEAAVSGGASRAGDPAARTASIIIRTKNEAADLGRTLTAVLGQNPPPHEVIVVDSGSTDGTLDVARRFPVATMEIAPEEWSYSRAINLAAARATGDLLICLSAHCEPVTDRWLASLVRHFDDPSVAGVWGPNLRRGRDHLRPGPPQRQLPGTYTVRNRSWGLSNGNSAIRRARWEDVPFDEDLPATEDKAWGLAMLGRGYVIVHDPEAAVWHEEHTLANAYRRNLAVQAGFRRIFPELDAPYSNQIRMVVRTAASLLATRLRDRDAARLWRDVKRAPRVGAALVGGVVGVRSDTVRMSGGSRPRPTHQPEELAGQPGRQPA